RNPEVPAPEVPAAGPPLPPSMLRAPLTVRPREQPPRSGTSVVGRMLLIVAPAVLAAAATRPRGASATRSRSE
ncbi:hypothetical protein, partial [Streptomyces sparsus]